MPVFGYRVFIVELFNGTARMPVDFSAAGDDGKTHYKDIVTDLLHTMQGKTLIEQRRAEPDDDAAPDGQDAASSDRLLGGKALSIRKVHLQEQSLYGEMLVGRFGDHETALSAPVLVDDTEADDDTEAGAESKIDQGSTDVSLAGRAPARRFRFVLTLPVKGKKAVLVVEDISASCPVDPLVRQLRQHSREGSTARGRDDPKRGVLPWWRPSVTPAMDNAYFTEMIEQGKLNKVELVRHSVGGDGQRRQETLRVTAPNPEALSVAGQFQELVERWVTSFRSRQSPEVVSRRRRSKEERAEEQAAQRARRLETDAGAAREMAALLGEELKDIDFDDGWIVLNDGNRTKKISPTRISELFNYVLNEDRRPSNLEWYEAARNKALRLATPLKLSLTWPDTLDFSEEDAS